MSSQTNLFKQALQVIVSSWQTKQHQIPTPPIPPTAEEKELQLWRQEITRNLKNPTVVEDACNIASSPISQENNTPPSH